MIIVYIDGLCEPVNPGGTGTFGYVIRDDTGKLITKQSGIVSTGPSVSNNVAEYAAVCEALSYLLKEKLQSLPVEVRSDSTLVVNQMKGKWKARKGLYIGKYEEAKQLSTHFPELGFKWIPRELNEEADALSREAYERARQPLASFPDGNE